MYKHTFFLVGGETIETTTKKKDIPAMRYGQLYTFVIDNGRTRLTIPVLSILYVDTEEMDAEG